MPTVMLLLKASDGLADLCLRLGVTRLFGRV